MRGMYVDIWRPAHGVDTSMNGISRRFDTVILVGEGVPEIVETDEDNKRAPAVQLYRRWVGTPEEYLHAQPIGWGRGQGLGPMFGGAFIYSSDSRFRELCKYPIPLHDRYEIRDTVSFR